jgi:hypothetical protein
MEKVKISIILISLICGIYFYSCDDSGQLPSNIQSGSVRLSQSNLKTVDPGVDGVFQLWIAIDTANQREWFSAGRFNINSSGGLVGADGNALNLVFSGDTNRLHLASHGLVTLEKDNDLAPSPYRIMSGPLTVTADSVYGTLTLAGGEALGNVGVELGALGAPYAQGRYILNSPTTNNAECLRGLWFCDPQGNAQFPIGINLPGNSGWKYQAWLYNIQLQQYYPIGRFRKFNQADEDGPGPCAGLNPGFDIPGQDWITSGGNCPAISNLNNGTYSVFITLEPFDESGNALSSPFFLRLFDRIGGIQSSLQCGQLDPFIRSMAADQRIPRATVSVIR